MFRIFLAVLAALLVYSCASGAEPSGFEQLDAACRTYNGGKPFGGMFCDCLVDEMRRRVSEQEMDDYAKPEPSASDRKVDEQGNAAAAVCREKVAEQSTRI